MSDPLFLATRRPDVFVSREEELETIKTAIYSPSSSFQVVILRGEGGVGKSRLMDEVLWRGGNPAARNRQPTADDPKDWDWTKCGKAVVADVLDMTDSDLHIRGKFMRAIRDNLIRAKSSINFQGYDVVYSRFQRMRGKEGDYQTIQKLEAEAERAFFEAFNSATKTNNERFVIILDTCERLAYSHSNWLIKEKLIKQEELTFNTAQWLANQIQHGRLQNITLILAGRAVEGYSFFDLIKSAISTGKKAKHSCDLKSIEIKPFNQEETGLFFKQVETTLRKDSKGNTDASPLADNFARISKDERRLEVLHRYTQGQPVRLSLYADLLFSNLPIPERLKDSPEEARKHSNKALRELIREEIDAEFINRLFRHPGIRSEVLKALVRCPRGLSMDQLTIAVFGPSDDISDIEKAGRYAKVQEEFETLRALSIIKKRPDGRLGLQDEIYRIYANCMDLDARNLEDEQRARKKLYPILREFAYQKRMEQEEERRGYQEKDQRELVVQSPAKTRMVQFPDLSEREMARRTQILETIRTWEQEELHYRLLCDLTTTLNNALAELSHKKYWDNDEEADFLILEEVYQVLYDEATIKFLEIPGWNSLNKLHVSPIHSLRLFMRQNEVTGWMRRFYLRAEKDRFMEFYNEFENWVQNQPSEEEKKAWNHTFGKGERRIWYDYSLTLWGNAKEAVVDLQSTIRDLERLARVRDKEFAFKDREEYGFIGHPGLNRLNVVIALAYNFLGYACVNAGQLREAIRNYVNAIAALRTSSFDVFHASVLNNLSRALSDIGRGRAYRICQDGFNIRKQLGSERQMAYSYNTLALINNDRMRPDLAWEEAAKAVAYFRRAEDPRGLGLALNQLGEALRRLAKQELSGRILQDTPEAIYDEAERLLEEAVDIFTNGPAKHELVRRVEAWIEMGCLLRDRIRMNGITSEKKAQTYADALNYLELAVQLAKEKGYSRLALDAQVNIAWTHHYFEKYDDAQKMIDEAEESIPKDAIITKNYLPHPARDDSYLFQQLSKLYGLRAILEMQRYVEQTKRANAADQESVETDRQEGPSATPEVRKHLQMAAEYFVLGLAYAQLFSVRSSALTALFDAVYYNLRDFPQENMEAFYKFQKDARAKYRIEKLQTEDLSDLGVFMRECISNFGEE